MKRHRLWLALSLLVVLGALLGAFIATWVRGKREVASVVLSKDRGDVSSPVPLPASPQAKLDITGQGENLRRSAEIVRSVYAAPIEFYGRVLDQNGDAVPGATADFGAMDKFFEDGSNYSAVSDVNGYFSISGIKGAALTVGLSKLGYDPLHGRSNGSFGYGIGADSERKAPPTREQPAIFVLRKKMKAEPLVHISSRQFDVGRSGESIEVNLSTGKLASGDRADIRVECTIGQQSGNEYDWKYRVSVPGGGLMERNASMDFEAPEGGYHESEEVAMTTNDPQKKWSRQAERHYFLKLSDGHHARAGFTFYTGARTFFVLESFLNPSGSRALEYDPTQKALR